MSIGQSGFLARRSESGAALVPADCHRFGFNPHADPRKMPEISRRWDLIDAHYVDVIRSVIDGCAPWPLVLVGPAGVGKTCAALSVLDMAPPQTLYRTADQAAKELIAAMKGTLPFVPSELAWWDRWRDATCVVLDELGQRNPSDHAYETIKRAIDWRREQPAIFVSNVELVNLAAIYDERIYSRLNAGTVIEMSGADRRGEP